MASVISGDVVVANCVKRFTARRYKNITKFSGGAGYYLAMTAETTRSAHKYKRVLFVFQKDFEKMIEAFKEVLPTIRASNQSFVFPDTSTAVDYNLFSSMGALDPQLRIIVPVPGDKYKEFLKDLKKMEVTNVEPIRQEYFMFDLMESVYVPPHTLLTPESDKEIIDQLIDDLGDNAFSTYRDNDQVVKYFDAQHGDVFVIESVMYGFTGGCSLRRVEGTHAHVEAGEDEEEMPEEMADNDAAHEEVIGDD